MTNRSQAEQEYTRRQALLAGIGVVGAAVVGGCSDRGDETNTTRQDEPEVKPTGYVDSHSHVWPADTVRYPLGSWTSKDEMSPAEFTAEQLLAIAKPAGVDRIVLIQHAPYYGYDGSYLIDCAKQHPGAFSIVGMIDEREPRLSERLKKQREEGIRGIRIGPTKHADRTLVAEPARWLEAPGMIDLWKVAAAEGVAVCPLVAPEFLPMLDPMCERHPETVCVVDHFGHIDPAKPDTVADLLKLARHSNVYVKVSAFYKFGDKRAPYEDVAAWIKPVYEAFGPQRLMWGSDCPYQLQNDNNYADSVALIREQLEFLSPADRTAILRDTATKVFFS